MCEWLAQLRKVTPASGPSCTAQRHLHAAGSNIDNTNNETKQTYVKKLRCGTKYESPVRVAGLRGWFSL